MEAEVVCLNADHAVKIIQIKGSMNVNTADQIHQEVAGQVAENSSIAVDLSECVYVSSSGLRVLLLIAKQAKARRSKVIYAAATPEVKDVLEMTGFSRVLECTDTLEQALQKLN